MKHSLGYIGEFSARQPKLTIALVIAIGLLGMVFATNIQMQMGMKLYIDHDSPVWQEWEGLKDDFGRGNNVFVIIRSDDFNNPDVIQMIEQLDMHYSKIPDIKDVMSISDLIKQVNNGVLPTTSEGVKASLERIPPEQLKLYMPKDGLNIILASYGNADTEHIVSSFNAETKAVKSLPGTSIIVTGQPIFEQQAFGLMLPEMIIMFAGAFLMIIIVLHLVMRDIRGRFRQFLPLATVLIGMMWMMGFMGLTGYNFNAIMLGVMPISMGLGISYAVQIQSRYEEERVCGGHPIDCCRIAVSTSGKGLTNAMLTTIIGLGSLLFSSVPPVRQFGAVSSVSIIANMIISLTFVPAFLSLYDPGFKDAVCAVASEGTKSNFSIESVFEKIIEIVTWKPLITLMIVSILFAGGMYGYTHVPAKQEMLKYWPQELQAHKDIDQLIYEVESPSVITLIFKSEGLTNPTHFNALYQFENLLSKDSKVNTVDSITAQIIHANGGVVPQTSDELQALFAALPQNVIDKYFSRGQSQFATDLYIDDINGKKVDDLNDKIISTSKFTGLGADNNIIITGKPILNRKVITNVTSGLVTMTLISFTLGLIFLLIAYRNIRTPIVLIVTIVTALAWVGGLMYLLDIPWNPLTVTMGSITLGIGIDFGIHLYERFEEQRKLGDDPKTAIRVSASKLARPIIASAATAAAGFGVLMFSRFPVLFNFGKTIVLSQTISLVVSFLVLPPLIVLVENMRHMKSKKNMEEQ